MDHIQDIVVWNKIRWYAAVCSMGDQNECHTRAE